MKKKEKQMIGVLILGSIVIIIIIFFITRPKDNEVNSGVDTTGETNVSQEEFTKVQEDGTIVNTSEKLKENKEIQGFEIKNIKFQEKNGETIFSARITNKTGSMQESFFGNIVLLDKKGKETGRIPVMISETQVGESIDIEAIILDINYTNAYDFKLEK